MTMPPCVALVWMPSTRRPRLALAPTLTEVVAQLDLKAMARRRPSPNRRFVA